MGTKLDLDLERARVRARLDAIPGPPDRLRNSWTNGVDVLELKALEARENEKKAERQHLKTRLRELDRLEERRKT